MATSTVAGRVMSATSAIRATGIVRPLVASLALVLGSAAAASAQAAEPEADSVRAAVERFYRWYVPAASRAAAAPWMAALAGSGVPDVRVSAGLAQALRQDSVVRASAVGESAGLDYDPFLGSQDPCAQYTVGRVRRMGASYLVEVAGSGGCATHAGPDVVVELEACGPALVIRNLHDPRHPDGDLRSVLARLHPDTLRRQGRDSSAGHLTWRCT
jgi:hypothetical protein